MFFMAGYGSRFKWEKEAKKKKKQKKKREKAYTLHLVASRVTGEFPISRRSSSDIRSILFSLCSCIDEKRLLKIQVIARDDSNNASSSPSRVGIFFSPSFFFLSPYFLKFITQFLFAFFSFFIFHLSSLGY